MKEWAARGRDFEQIERSGWKDGEWVALGNEAVVALAGTKRGRVDILVELDDASRVVIELKATDWDSMAAHRVRPNLRRHVRQVLAYADSFLDRGEKVHPALVYPRPPESAERRQLIESTAHGAFVQVVWRGQ